MQGTGLAQPRHHGLAGECGAPAQAAGDEDPPVADAAALPSETDEWEDAEDLEGEADAEVPAETFHLTLGDDEAGAVLLLVYSCQNRSPSRGKLVIPA